MGSDEVNSIGDSPEAMQVAECIRTSYYNMLGRYDLPEHNQLFQLDPSNDATKPTLMYRPEGINRIEWLRYYNSNIADSTSSQQGQFGAYSHGLNTDLINTGVWQASSTTTNTIGEGSVTFIVQGGLQITIGGPATAQAGNNSMSGTVIGYNTSNGTLNLHITSTVGAGTFSAWFISGIPSPNTAPGYLDVQLVSLYEFLNHVGSFNLTEDNVGSYVLSVPQINNAEPMPFQIRYKTDRQPRYWTIVQNYYIFFDSFDSTQDSTIQASKTLAYGWVMPPFILNDTFVPSLDEQQFPLLINESKSLAFLELKQMEHPKAEKEVYRQLSSLQKFKFTAHRPTPFQELPNFGRRIGTGGYALYKANPYFPYT